MPTNPQMVKYVNRIPFKSVILLRMTKNALDMTASKMSAKNIEATAIWAILIFLFVNLLGIHIPSHVRKHLLVFNGSIL